MIRSYLWISALFTLSASLIWGINTLFLLDAGLNNAEAFAANAFFTAGMVVFEIPTGALADTWGRRTSYLLGAATLALVDSRVRRLAAGYGGALQTGFRSATKELVFYTDGDGQYDAGQLVRLVERAGASTDVVQGYKRGRADSRLRTLAGVLCDELMKLRAATEAFGREAGIRTFSQSERSRSGCRVSWVALLAANASDRD